MSKVFAVFTSDPNLIRCELHRLKAEVDLTAGPESNAVGLGSYAQEVVLLQHYASEKSLPPLDELGAPESEAVLYHAERLPLGRALEENTQPFRFRHWLFAHVGQVSGFEWVRPRLLSLLPEHLSRALRGDTDSEAAFALFLKHLRDTGRTDDRSLEVATGARLLGNTVQELEELAKEAGATGRSSLNFVTTNGRMLLASRSGPEPLYYSLLEGTDRCERCEIDQSTPDTLPLKQAHRRRRTVVVSSSPSRPTGWIEIQSGTVVAVDRASNVQTLPIQGP
ncbi:MAG: class II glutamine amidotransferase [Myxococcaceae bacterium]